MTDPLQVVFIVFAVLMLGAAALAWLAQKPRKPVSTQPVFEPRLLPAMLEVPRMGCANAAPPDKTLDLSVELIQDLDGYCVTHVYRDGVLLWDPLTAMALGQPRQLKVADVERWATERAALDWRIVLTEAMRQLVYQRHQSGQWNLVSVEAGIVG